MGLSKIFKRELEVAFSKAGQPLWFRMLKYSLMFYLLYLLKDSEYLWPILITAFFISLTVHLWFRYKTKGWTQDYGPWKYNKIIKH
ncbi:hypothetical protein LEP1GSC172_3725 [Leptospira noguchii]|uniref:DUF418 domain-containing protein n=1 Tax=Leptospira noguchii TaxID=28182 RepID=M6V9H9_9LEPT|nr:hypothetical protein LEP1GSC172_3725 [Leptospira noguchii]